jgi:hypothetical protein
VSLAVDPIRSGIAGGSSSKVEMKLLLGDSGSTSGAGLNSMAEARLELAGMEVSPNATMSQGMPAGRPVQFHWSFVSPMDRDSTGQVWLYIIVTSPRGDLGEKRPVSVQPVEVRAVDFLGLDGLQARALGWMGIVLGGVLTIGSSRGRKVHVLVSSDAVVEV